MATAAKKTTRAPAKKAARPAKAPTRARASKPTVKMKRAVAEAQQPLAIAPAPQGAVSPLPIEPPAAPVATAPVPEDRFVQLPIGSVKASPLNPRKRFDPDKHAELVKSVKGKGVLQPIMVRPAVDPTAFGADWEIILGERRHRAATAAELETIPTRIREVCSDDELVELAATENMARADMDPVDEAYALGAMRDAAERAGRAINDAWAEEIGGKIGMSARTVWRRLDLLKLSEPVREALQERKINLQQASMFQLGDEARQAKVLQQITAPGGHAHWMAAPERIRAEMIDSKPAIKEALFAPEAYTGEIVEDAETGERWFADAQQFERLQRAAIAEQKAKMAAKWAWCDVLEGQNAHKAYQYESAKSGERGCIIVFHSIFQKPRIEGGMLRPKPGSSGRASATSGTPAPRQMFTEKQRIMLHHARTRAMRTAVAQHHDVRIGVAITILGMLNGPEIALRTEARHGSDQPDHRISDDIDLERAFAPLKDTLASLRLKVGGNDYGGQVLGPIHDLNKPATQVALFDALRQVDLPRLLQLQQVLVSRRIGSWCAFDAKLGVTPLTEAIADASGAEDVLIDAWDCSRDYLGGFMRDDLFTLALCAANARGEIEPALNSMTKGQLVEFCVKRLATFDATALPEVSFSSTAALEKRLEKGPRLDVPAGSRAQLDLVEHLQQQLPAAGAGQAEAV